MTPRPKRTDANVVRFAAEQCADAILAEIPDAFEDLERDGAIEDLARAMSRDSDSFAICQALSRRSWYVNDEIYDVVSRGWIDSAHRRAVEDWVKAWNVTPRCALGCEVTIEIFNAKHDGIVSAIDIKRAEYTVRVPALGHVESGLGTHGYVFTFEDVERHCADARSQAAR